MTQRSFLHLSPGISKWHAVEDEERDRAHQEDYLVEGPWNREQSQPNAPPQRPWDPGVTRDEDDRPDHP